MCAGRVRPIRAQPRLRRSGQVRVAWPWLQLALQQYLRGKAVSRSRSGVIEYQRHGSGLGLWQPELNCKPNVLGCQPLLLLAACHSTIAAWFHACFYLSMPACTTLCTSSKSQLVGAQCLIPSAAHGFVLFQQRERLAVLLMAAARRRCADVNLLIAVQSSPCRLIIAVEVFWGLCLQWFWRCLVVRGVCTQLG